MFLTICYTSVGLQNSFYWLVGLPNERGVWSTSPVLILFPPGVKEWVPSPALLFLRSSILLLFPIGVWEWLASPNLLLFIFMLIKKISLFFFKLIYSFFLDLNFFLDSTSIQSSPISSLLLCMRGLSFTLLHLSSWTRSLSHLSWI